MFNFYILPKHLVGGTPSQLTFLYVNLEEKKFCSAIPPSDTTCLDQNRIFKVKTREDRMVKDESIQRVEMKKIETLYTHFSYRGKTINCSNGGKKIGTVLQMSLECTLKKQLHREDRSKLM